MLAAVVAPAALAAANFSRLPCPTGVFSTGCTYQNTASSDQAISMFFQFEPAQGEASGHISCTGDGVTYCSRSWQAEATGSAGQCWFILGAGRSFTCGGQGTVNVLGAHWAPISGTVIAPSPSQAETIPCTGSSGCSYANTGGDAWVGMVFSASTNASLSCTYGSGVRVCDWGVNGAGGGGSCNFLLPASATLSCQGNAQVTAAALLRFSRNLIDANAAAEQWDCPKKTYPKTDMCDCTIYNPHKDKDLAVVVNVQSVDDSFNSFHCFYNGANVCAWGNNKHDDTDRGNCYFMLPAGEELFCTMQWGAASFTYSNAFAMRGTIFSLAETEEATPSVPGIPAMPERELRRAFDEWKKQHGRKYGSAAEEAVRYNNFREHVNLAGRKPRYNHLADLSRQEFEDSYRGCGKVSERGPARGWTAANTSGLPASVDWRTKNVVTPAKDQGQCGACWSFSTTGAIESAWAIAGHGLQSLSEQQLVSCDTADGNAGCKGGWPDKAMDWVKQNGIDTEQSYPYASASGTSPGCTTGHTRAAATVTGHVEVAKDEDAMAAYVAQHGPLSVCVDAMTQLWWPYTGGIMTGCCNKACDHAVLIVGYGEDNGQKFWLIKNSWNAKWGENGYLRLERGTNQCGITTAPVGVVVAGSPTPAPPVTPVPATPAPTTPPTPAPPGDCPAQAVKNGTSCMWVNGTNGVSMPPSDAIQPYCAYFATGYFGYLWSTSRGDYPCPTAGHSSESPDDHFCVFDNRKKGVNWPSSATADCTRLKEGVLGYRW
eukprot:TRINITY_DN2817_c0_g1_i1.p1 TRINITY_DN2817_c0_g1~~TRINITY_DN2817_c0_g1_i1.p1  ORF type:complete len:787 (+),score=161.39 TRINITY_DN2817_c0_g1_i1:52-2361(+)